MSVRGRSRHGDRVVERYLHEVSVALPGPSSARRSALDEIRDHLIEEHDQLVMAGLHSDEAAVRATRVLGPPRRLAAGLVSRVGGVAIRRLAFSVPVLTATVCAVWLAVFLTGPHAPWSEVSEPWALAIADTVGSLAMLTALTSGLAAVALWMLPRAVGRAGFVESARAASGRVAAWGACMCSVGIVTILAYVSIRATLAPRSVEWPDIILGTLTTLFALGVLLSVARSHRSVPVKGAVRT